MSVTALSLIIHGINGRTAALSSCYSRAAAATSAALARPPSSHSRMTWDLSSAAARVRRSAAAREEVALACAASTVASATLVARVASACLREASRAMSEATQTRTVLAPLECSGPIFPSSVLRLWFSALALFLKLRSLAV